MSSIPEGVIFPEAHALTEVLQPSRPTGPVTLTPDVVEQLYATGWSGVGLALHITDTNGDLLIAEHKQTRENLHHSWGPITETVRWSSSAVENLLLTAARCIHEELGVENPDALGMRTTAMGLTLSRWARPAGNILAFTMPLLISDDARDNLISNPPDTKEIASVRFIPAEEVRKLPKLRDGTASWLTHLASAGLLDGPVTATENIEFPPITDDGAFQDIDLSRVTTSSVASSSRIQVA